MNGDELEARYSAYWKRRGAPLLRLAMRVRPRDRRCGA